jgi:hypothetical protein
MRVGANILRSSGSYNLAASSASSRTEIDHVIGLGDGIFVMLNDDHRVPRFLELSEGFE